MKELTFLFVAKEKRGISILLTPDEAIDLSRILVDAAGVFTGHPKIRLQLNGHFVDEKENEFVLE